MSHHYKLGYSHGLQGGLDAYKPAQRKAGGAAFAEYGQGFTNGCRDRHEAQLPNQSRLALLNLPRAQREVKKLLEVAA
jgi:hypothetical protein